MAREPEGRIEILSEQILRCKVEVIEHVDTPVSVATKWTLPPSLQNDSRITISAVKEHHPLFYSSVVIDAYTLNHSGNYTCTANVIPDLIHPGPVYGSAWTTEVLVISACKL